MKGVGWVLAIFLAGFSAVASAQDKIVDRTVQGQAGKDVRVGAYVNVQDDCHIWSPPTIRLSTPATHGRVIVKKAKVSATNYKQCLALEVTGFVAFYRSQPDFSGNDVFALEVKYPSGRTETQRFTVTIAAAGSTHV